MATDVTMLSNVALLSQLHVPDDQPDIESATVSVRYIMNQDDRFEGRDAFGGQFAEETKWIAQLHDLKDKGDAFSAMLYTYRGCSRAIPLVQSNEQANRMQIYENTITVLEPEVEKLKALMAFNESAAAEFCGIVGALARAERKKVHTSNELLLEVARVLHVFGVLDALKNMKACLNNDFSFYKRAFGLVKKNQMTDQIIMENQQTNMFLAQQNTISDNLKAGLEKIDGYDEVISAVVHCCAEYYEQGLWVVPEDKHILLNTMAFGLFLMDGKSAGPAGGVFKNKKLHLDTFARTFKQTPVVPLFGDLQITLIQYIRRCPHFDEVKWAAAEGDGKVEPYGPAGSYNILHNVGLAKQAHAAFIADFTCTIDAVQTEERRLAHAKAKARAGGGAGGLAVEQLSPVLDVTLRGLQLMSEWTNHAMELHAWKLSHPADKYTNRACPDDAEQYERAIRYNYSSNEKFALIELTALLKGVAGVFTKHEAQLSRWVNLAVHAEFQQFVYGPLTDLLKLTTKKKKKGAEAILAGVHEACADVVVGMRPAGPPPTAAGGGAGGGGGGDFGTIKKSSSSKTAGPEMVPEIEERAVGPSPLQLYVARARLESLVSGKGGGSKKGIFEKDFKAEQLAPLEAFVSRSLFYRPLLELNQSVGACSELGHLWFREFFLELTMGARIQFPIEMSLPWMLTDHILETAAPSMMEYLLYPLDLYNSSANYALHTLKKQFLYDEVEAEVNLCFDQFVFKLSEQIFAYYKMQASQVMLSKGLKSELERSGGGGGGGGGDLRVITNRYATILKQRHVQLLGRSIDLGALLAQRLNTNIKRSIDYAITRFESDDLTGIVRLESLLANTQLAHALLAEHVALDPWEMLFNEANESTSVTSFHGRIVLHTLWELAYDLIPNFCFNTATQRFVRTKLSFVDDVERASHPRAKVHFWYGSKALNAAFGALNHLYSGFFGMPHINALLRILGFGNMPLLMEELVKNVAATVKNILAPYVTSLLEGLPPKLKLPIYDYGSSGALGFFQLQLQPIISYKELKTEVFQAFREVGNALIVLNLLERSLHQEESFSSLQAAPYLGVRPAPFNDDPDLVFVNRLRAVASAEQLKNAAEAERSCRRLWQHQSLFKAILDRLARMLALHFAPVPPANGVVAVEECRDFRHLWSSLQFAFCAPGNAHEFTPDELFGEGLQWGGITMTYLLGQADAFNVFDFSYHVSKINQVDGKDENVSGMNLQAFCRNVERYRRRNDQLLNLLRKRYPLDAAGGAAGGRGEEACFHPPTYDPQ